MLKIKVNNDLQYEVQADHNQIMVNSQVVDPDIQSVGDTEWHVLLQNKSFKAEVIAFNSQEKTCSIRINGNDYHIAAEDQFDLLLKQLGMDNLTSNKVLDVKAPMPGLVLQVIVAENTEVRKGDNLLVLEAMKMENILKSPGDGIIKKVCVVQGDKVEKNQVLILFA